MVVKDIIKIATAMLFEASGNDVDFIEFSPALLNMLAAEALPYENSYRASLGQDELASAPVITDDNSEIPYCDAICRIALPYGLTAFYWQDENNEYRAQDARGRYIDALKEASRAVAMDATDEYKTEE